MYGGSGRVTSVCSSLFSFFFNKDGEGGRDLKIEQIKARSFLLSEEVLDSSGSFSDLSTNFCCSQKKQLCTAALPSQEAASITGKNRRGWRKTGAAKAQLWRTAPPSVRQPKVADRDQIRLEAGTFRQVLVPSSWSRCCPAEPHRSPCVSRRLCTWSRWASGRTGSRCWSSRLRGLHTSAASALPASWPRAWKHQKDRSWSHILMFPWSSGQPWPLILSVIWHKQSCDASRWWSHQQGF